MEEKRRHKRLDIDVSDLMQRYLSIYIHIMTPGSKFGPGRLWMRLSRLYEEQTVKKEYITMVLCLSV